MTARPGFRRAVVLAAEARVIAAEVEDDFHHFGLRLDHDGARVTQISGLAKRYPWSTCAEAGMILANLAGVPLSANPAELFRLADPKRHCTHLFELAALAIAAAARPPETRRYDAEVDDPAASNRGIRLFRDGALIAERAWDEDLAQLSSRALAALAPDEAEAMLILRRVAQTAGGRAIDVDRFAKAAEMGRAPVCYTYQLGQAARASRMVGSAIDWTSPENMAARAKPLKARC